MARAIPQKKVSQLSQAPGVRFWHSKYFSSWFIFFAAFILFAKSISGGYNLDDELVTINHRLTSKGISAIPQIFTSHYYQDEQGYAYEYRPLVLTTFAIEHQFFGDNAQVSHFFNVFFYALTCLVLLRVLLQLFKSYSPLLSVAITLLFVVHPAHTEVVSSIKNRDEILGLLFSLLTLYAAIKVIETNKWWLVLVPVLFALALMGKATVISFTIIIPLALIFFTRANWRTVLLITGLLAIPSFFLLNMSNVLIKILLLIGAMALAMLVFAVVNFGQFKNYGLPLLYRINGALFSNNAAGNSPLASINEPLKLSNIRSRFVMPHARLLALAPFTVTVGLAATYLYCNAQLHSLIAIFPLAILLMVAWKGEERFSWWATVALGVCVALNVATPQTTNNERLIFQPYCDFAGTYLVIQLLFGKKNMFVPALATVILFVVVHFFAIGRFHIYYLILLLFINEKYVLNAVLLLHVASLLTLGRFSHEVNYWLDFIRIGLQVVTLIWIKLNRAVKFLPAVLLISSLCLFHAGRIDDTSRFNAQQTIFTLEKASDKINPQIISAPQDRPLMYVEECIDTTTSTSVKLGTASGILLRYLGKVVIPYPLSFYYGYKYIYPQKITRAVPLLGVLLYLLLFIAAVYLIKKDRPISFGIFTYLVSIAIFANFIEPVPGMFADRFLLIPSLGWAIVLVAILQKIFKANLGTKTTLLSQLPGPFRYSLAIIILLYGSYSFARNMDWHDDLTLMKHDINVVPQSVQAQNLLGIHLLTNSFSITDPVQQAQQRHDAIAHIKIANALSPGFFNYNYDLGRAYTLLNIPDSALLYFNEAYHIDTTYHDVPLNIANIYLGKGNYTAAIPYLIKVMQITPGDYNLYAQLSYAYYSINRFDLSIQTNKQAIIRFPGQVQPYVNIATCYTSLNANDSARQWLTQALAIAPGNPEITAKLNSLK